MFIALILLNQNLPLVYLFCTTSTEQVFLSVH